MVDGKACKLCANYWLVKPYKVAHGFADITITTGFDAKKVDHVNKIIQLKKIKNIFSSIKCHIFYKAWI